MRYLPGGIALLALACVVSAPRPASADAVADVLAGVQRIASPGVPGPLCVYGDQVWSIVVGDGGNATRLPVVATGVLGAGRVVAFGHDGYLGEDVLRTADTGRLMTNVVRWAARNKTRPRVGVVGASGAATYLRQQGLTVDEIDVSALTGHDVVVIAPWNQTPGEVATLAAFVRAGGGLVAAATGWGWAQLNPERDLQMDYAGNRLLAAAGIQWADDYLGETAGGGGYDVPGPPSDLTTARPALAAAEADAAGTRVLTPPERTQVSRTLVANAACVPPDDTLFLPRLADATRETVVPSPADPVTADEVLDRLAVVMQTRALDALPVTTPRAHPGAAVFPGAVPADAPRLTRTITVDTTVPDWHSTGLYAPPGEVVTVRVPPDAAGRGLGLRIGPHTDTLWGIQDDWTRMPDVSRAWSLAAAETRVFSPYGGLVYVTVARLSGLGTVEVAFGGVVEAPLFLAGRTDPSDWPRIRALPGPWAEIGSGKMVVTVPAVYVRDLDDPGAVVAAWDRVMDLDADLAGWTWARERAERFVTDQQIAYGYMHAGYPIMCFFDQAAHLVDARHLSTEGNWGFFHEVGHNHQSGDWTFDGTGEVTVNLFTLYTYEHLVGIPTLANERGSVAFVREELRKYDWDAPDFAQWRSDPFLALAMYVQLQHAFGWEAFRRVFAEFRDLPASERPQTDDQKRDQWLVRFSRAVGRDLGGFFAAWGVPVTAGARAAVADLPDWMPRDFPPGYDLDPTTTPSPTVTATPVPPSPTATAMPTTVPVAPTPTGPPRGVLVYLPVAGTGR
jgi:hypothetical protein